MTNRETVENNSNGHIDLGALISFAEQTAKLEKKHPGASTTIEKALRHTWRMEWAWFFFGFASLLIALISVAICAYVSIELVRNGAFVHGTVAMVSGSASVAAVFLGKRIAATPIRRKQREKAAAQPAE